MIAKDIITDFFYIHHISVTIYRPFRPFHRGLIGKFTRLWLGQKKYGRNFVLLESEFHNFLASLVQKSI